MGAKATANAQEAIQYHLVKSKLYKIVSVIFAIVGLFMFFFFAITLIGNDPTAIIKQPWIVIYMILPFLPAYVLSMIAEKHRKKLKQLVEKNAQG
jgi:uncharacterized protein YacL